MCLNIKSASMDEALSCTKKGYLGSFIFIYSTATSKA